MKNYSRANTGIDLNLIPVFIEVSVAAVWQKLCTSGDVAPRGESGIKTL